MPSTPAIRRCARSSARKNIWPPNTAARSIRPISTNTCGTTVFSRCAARSKNCSPEKIIEEIEASGLRGRGGAGFPTGNEMGRRSRTPLGRELKYVLCNGDEGDPGAFMDRMLLESFPYRIIEGMAIAARAVGAREGFFYIRAEYPLAVKRIDEAIEVCDKRGFLGEKILGSDFNLQLSVKEGAGAFVCGEETALIASIEGRRGMPRLRPPFPAAMRACGKSRRWSTTSKPTPSCRGFSAMERKRSPRSAPPRARGRRFSRWPARCAAAD